MSDTYHSGFRTKKPIGQSRQQLVEIHDHIRLRFTDHTLDITNTPYIFIGAAQIVNDTTDDMNLLVLGRRQEIRALKRIDGRMNLIDKERGQTPGRTFSYQHANNRMPLRLQLLP